MRKSKTVDDSEESVDLEQLETIDHGSEGEPEAEEIPKKSRKSVEWKFVKHLDELKDVTTYLEVRGAPTLELFESEDHCSRGNNLLPLQRC